MTSLVWLTVALPLLGFLVNGLLGRRLPAAAVSVVGCALPALSFVVTLGVFTQLLATASAPPRPGCARSLARGACPDFARRSWPSWRG